MHYERDRKQKELLREQKGTNRETYWVEENHPRKIWQSSQPEE